MDAAGTVQGPALLPWNWLSKRRERGRQGGREAVFNVFL